MQYKIFQEWILWFRLLNSNVLSNNTNVKRECCVGLFIITLINIKVIKQSQFDKMYALSKERGDKHSTCRLKFIWKKEKAVSVYLVTNGVRFERKLTLQQKMFNCSSTICSYFTLVQAHPVLFKIASSFNILDSITRRQLLDFSKY